MSPQAIIDFDKETDDASGNTKGQKQGRSETGNNPVKGFGFVQFDAYEC